MKALLEISLGPKSRIIPSFTLLAIVFLMLGNNSWAAFAYAEVSIESSRPSSSDLIERGFVNNG